MQKVKWIFFCYLALVALLVLGMAVSFVKTPPRDPNTFYTFYLDNVKTMDPAECDDEQSANMIGNVYETLYTYEYGTEPYKLIPQLAQDMPVCVRLQCLKLCRNFLSLMLLKVGQSAAILQRLRDFFKNRREFLDVGVRRGAICQLSVETQVVIHESESLVGCGRNWLHLNLAAKKI